jgi:hypothetical protein
MTKQELKDYIKMEVDEFSKFVYLGQSEKVLLTSLLHLLYLKGSQDGLKEAYDSLRKIFERGEK